MNLEGFHIIYCGLGHGAIGPAYLRPVSPPIPCRRGRARSKARPQGKAFPSQLSFEHAQSECWLGSLFGRTSSRPPAAFLLEENHGVEGCEFGGVFGLMGPTRRNGTSRRTIFDPRTPKLWVLLKYGDIETIGIQISIPLGRDFPFAAEPAPPPLRRIAECLLAAARTFIVVFHVLGTDTADGEGSGIVGMLHVMDVADVLRLTHFAGLVRRAEIFHRGASPALMGNAWDAPFSSERRDLPCRSAACVSEPALPDIEVMIQNLRT